MATQLATTDDRQATAQPIHPIAKLNRDLELRAEQFAMVLPSHIKPDKFQRTIMTAVQSDPALLNVDRQSLLLACMRAAQDGLLPDKREAALVVFKENKKIDGQWVQRELAAYIPMAFGVRKKILQSEQVADISTNVVYAAEVARGAFIYEEGSARALRHRPLMDLKAEEATDDQIVAAYSMATLKDGTVSYEVMRRFEIDKVRETSQTGAKVDRKGQPRTPKGPWVDWFGEMAKKSVLKRHAKMLPQSGDILLDLQDDDDAQARGAASTISLLDGHEADGPRVIEDHSDDEPHDQETRELLGDQQAQDGERAKDSPAETKPKAQTKGKAEPKAKETPPAEQKPEAPAEPAKDPAPPQQQAGDPGPQPEGETAAADDDLSPSEKAAASWIESFEKCETIVDLDRLYRLSAADRSAMADDLREGVEAAKDAAENRLKGK